MTAARLILRAITATLAVIVVGTIGVFGFQLITPFRQAIDGPPASLGWGTPGATVATFASVTVIALLLVVVIWLIASPIRQDTRQRYQR
jgi:hypothetical protein